MAIKGNVQIEDLNIIFELKYGKDTPVMHVTVENLDGINETYTPNHEAFMIALGAALHFEGLALDPEKAEQAQPENPLLRFIP